MTVSKHPLAITISTTGFTTYPDLFGIDKNRQIDLAETLNGIINICRGDIPAVIRQIGRIPLSEAEYACVLLQLGAYFNQTGISRPLNGN